MATSIVECQESQRIPEDDAPVYYHPNSSHHPHIKPHITSIEHYRALHAQSLEHSDDFWSAKAHQLLIWERDFTTTLTGGFGKGDVKWFKEGALSPFRNIVRRHAEKHPDRKALVYEPDDPKELEVLKTVFTYRDLQVGAERVSAALHKMGVKKGDLVAIHMPMIPEAIMTMLACVRIGAPHSVVFAGFGHQALAQRICDGGCKVVVTVDYGMRGGRVIPIKQTVDSALLKCPDVEHVLVFARASRAVLEGCQTPPSPLPASVSVEMKKGRDIFYHDLVITDEDVPEESVNEAEDIFFVLYTSGSTGTPKGMVHTTGGYLVGAALTTRDIFDIHDGDVFACMADIGWITGHTYVTYGPLLLGITTLIFESTPLYPDNQRYYEVLARRKVTQLYTAPTVVRILRDAGGPRPELRAEYLKTLRILGSVGEMIGPEAWEFYYNSVGGAKCPVVDTFWQTENGSIILSPLAHATPLKPGSATLPLWGISPRIYRASPSSATPSTPLAPGNDGLLVITRPWPSIARTIWRNHERYMNAYFRKVPGCFFVGDQAVQDTASGYFWIRGRVDDIINVAGHRVSTAEVEASALEFPGALESAVVGIPHPQKGEALVIFLVHPTASPTTGQELIAHLRSRNGAIFTPQSVYVVPGLPKTRSGKIMRRILRKIAATSAASEVLRQAEERRMDRDHAMDLGDTSTLANRDVVEHILHIVMGAGKESPRPPRY